MKELTFEQQERALFLLNKVIGNLDYENNDSEDLKDEINILLNEVNEIEDEFEKTIPITLGFIKHKCGWSKFSDVTGHNPYMLNDWCVNDNEIFDVKISHAEKLGLI